MISEVVMHYLQTECSLITCNLVIEKEKAIRNLTIFVYNFNAKKLSCPTITILDIVYEYVKMMTYFTEENKVENLGTLPKRCKKYKQCCKDVKDTKCTDINNNNN